MISYRKIVAVIALMLAGLPGATANPAIPPTDKPVRLLILADMGNEPDEEQQMVHMLVCSNGFVLEGLIAVTGIWLRENPRPELFHKLIDGYEKVLPNLRQHAQGWHEPEYLRSITAAGQPAYGIDAVGEGKSTPGSRLIEEVILKDDPRPLWVVVNAGSNTLAQALFDLQKSRGPEEMESLLAKMRVYENGAQDNAGAWICHHFPDIHWIRSLYQTYAFGGPRHFVGPNVWKPHPSTGAGQHQWIKEHVQENHGALGALYPDRYFEQHGGFLDIEGGGTTPWIGLVNKGLFDVDHPHWGGWGGRFTREKKQNRFSKYVQRVRPDEQAFAPFFTYNEVSDYWVDPKTGVEYANNFVPVWRWREAMYNDFQCRMDWCVEPFEEANHHPQAAFKGDRSDEVVTLRVRPGETVELDAAGSSDPDGDSLEYRWWQYLEAGTYPGRMKIFDPGSAQARARVPSGAGGTEIHLVLEVRDRSDIAPLYDYRRIILRAEEEPVLIDRSID